MKTDKRNAYIALALVSFFWGTTYIAARIGTREVPGLFVAGIRQFLSGLLLVAFFLFRGYRLPSWKTMKLISIQGLLLLCIANGLSTWSVEFISGGLAAIIAAMVPLFIALFSVWLSKKMKLSAAMIIGLFIGLAGIVTIFYDYFGQLHERSFLYGVGLAVLSTLAWSFGTVYTSRNKPSVDILFGVGLQMLIAGIVILIVCGVTGKYVNIMHAGMYSQLALLYLIVFGSLLAYSAYVFAISKLPATQVSIYAYINPIVAVVLGWLLLSERMNAIMVLGMAITLTGVYIVNNESKKNIQSQFTSK